MLKKGFSLIELVVVILLIGILAAVAVPRLFGSTNKAHRAAVQRLGAQMTSSLNVIAGEWLLKGSPSYDVLDGVIYRMSARGYPDVTVNVDTSIALPNGTNDSQSGTVEGCRHFLHKIMGIPLTLIGIADDLSDERSENVDKNWVATFTGDGNASGACTFKYNTNNMQGASIVYAPSQKNAVYIVIPSTW